MQRLPVRTAVLSHVVPPSPGGQCVVLSKLLGPVDPRDYVVITHERQPPSPGEETAPPLPARHHAVARSISVAGGSRALGRLTGPVNMVANLLYRTAQIIRVLRREGCVAIVACSGDPYNLPAAYLASRALRVALHPYLFDDPVYQWAEPRYRQFARILSPRIMRGARSIIVPNEFMRDECRRRYGVDSHIVRNPGDESATAGEATGRSRPDIRADVEDSSGGLVYTGVTSRAHYDAFRNLVAALSILQEGQGGRHDDRLRLHIHTVTDEAVLRAEGIDGPVSVHGQRSQARIAAVQAGADVLFLPLGFQTPFPEVIRTSAPGKMGEYLASGRPILVHAPADSFIAWYFRTHRCGLVVDEPSAELLAAAVRRLIDDAALREELVANAQAKAREDFDVRVCREAFLHALDKQR